MVWHSVYREATVKIAGRLLEEVICGLNSTSQMDLGGTLLGSS